MIYTATIASGFCVLDTRNGEYYSTFLTTGRFIKISRSEAAHILRELRQQRARVERLK